MQINLKPNIQQYIDEQVRAGYFPTAEAVIEAAVQNEMATAGLSDEDMAAIDESQRELDTGQGLSFDDFAARTRKKQGIT